MNPFPMLRSRVVGTGLVIGLLMTSSASFAASPEPTPTKNPLPSGASGKPNSTAEEKAMKEQYKQYGFSPRTSKSQRDASSEPRPLDADEATDRDADRAIENNMAEANREYGSSPVSERRRRRMARGRRPKKNRQPLPERATTELMIRPQDRSQEVLATAATVTLKVDEVKSPIKQPSFLIGVSAQMYEARGRAQLQGVPSTDFGDTGARPMLNIDLRWTPLVFERVPRTRFGIFGSGGYVSHPIKITAPTGAEIENASLNTFKGEGGGVVEWHDTGSSNWGLRAQLSAGIFTATQSSSTSYAEGTATQRFLAAGAYYEYLIFDAVELSVGYERREPWGGSSADLVLQKDNFIVGVSGGFQ